MPLSRSLGIFGDSERDFAFGSPQPLPQCHIQHHHHAEAHHEKYRANVGVLELATGTGLIAKHIVKAAAHIEATDASPEMSFLRA